MACMCFTAWICGGRKPPISIMAYNILRQIFSFADITTYHLQHVASCLGLSESLFALHEFHHCLVRAQFHKDVNIFGIFEYVLEPNNVLMMKRLMNFNFCLKFRFVSLLHQGRFVHNLTSPVLSRIQIRNLKTSCKSPFTKQYAFAISFPYLHSKMISLYIFDYRRYLDGFVGIVLYF